MNYATLTAVPAVAVSVFGAGTVSGAQVYRWVDGNGTIHFSDKSPSEQGARDLQIKSTKAPPMYLSCLARPLRAGRL